jgi:hypothetical protein
MWIIAALLAGSVPLPPNTPIPCFICATAPSATTQSFSGTVQLVGPELLRVFNGKTHQSMSFTVPADFHGVESSDGKIKGAPLTRVPPGLLARVTYRTASDRRTVTQILLLTIAQCRALMAAEHLSNTPVECPD